MGSRKGFTLIELLAVLVILSILAVIAIPIAIKVVDEAERSAWKASAESYQKSVEQTLLKDALATSKDPLSSDCEIAEKGNLICLGINDTINIETIGEKPKSGNLTIEKGHVTNMRLVYEDRILITTSNGEVIVSEYELGEEVKIKNTVTFAPGMKWYVIGEDEDTVSLMLNFNSDESKWGTSTDEGPVNVMNNIISTLQDVYEEYGEKSGLELIEDYTYINNKDGKKYLYGYQKLEIKNGKTTITNKNGDSTTLKGDTYARLITEEEYVNILRTMPNLSLLELKKYILDNINYINQEYSSNFTSVEEILEYLNVENDYMYIYLIAYVADTLNDGTYNEIKPQPWVYDNMYTETSEVLTLGYWSSTARSNDKNTVAKLVFTYGMLTDTESIGSEKMIGPRPVITISKSKIEKID